ncbi:MAG: YajQ family cyclic di-GMP-binding protein [Epsilonproteobacteria bacterium]|nr:YajQ family cyclic di-GMP-binding protein [Campylobacterota bacterium]
MAKEHSFDITAELDNQEMKNAIEQAKKEVASRYDFKGIKAEIDYNEQGKSISLVSSSDSKAEAMMDMVIAKAIKRGISSKAIKEHSRDQVGGGNTKLVLAITDVISKDDAKKIVKGIKDKKLKVQAQIRGEEVRVTGKSIDDLQTCIKAVKEMDLDVPLNFTNLK